MEAREEFLADYRSDRVAEAFYNLLYGRIIERPDGDARDEAPGACISLFYSFQSGDPEFFDDVVESFSRRELNPHAQWWLNDLLMCGLVLCAAKYGKHENWIRSVLRYRVDRTTGSASEVGSTFIDVLSENWANAANVRPLSLVSHDLLNSDKTDQELIYSAYDSIVSSGVGVEESGFRRLVAIRAFDTAIIENLPASEPFRRASRRLADAVWRASNRGAWGVWWVGLACIAYAMKAVVLRVWDLETDSFEQNVLEFLALVGAPLFSLLPVGAWLIKRRQIVNWFRCQIACSLFDLDQEVLPNSVYDER